MPGRITSSSPLSESGGCKCKPCPGSQFTRVWCQTVGDSARNGDHAGASPVTLTILMRCRPTSRTAGFEPEYGGANPPAAASFRRRLVGSDVSGPCPDERRASRRAPGPSRLSGAASQRSSPIRRRSPVRTRPEPQFLCGRAGTSRQRRLRRAGGNPCRSKACRPHHLAMWMEREYTLRPDRSAERRAGASPAMATLLGI